MRYKGRFGEIIAALVLACLVTPVFAAIPPLHVDGNRIKDPNGSVVVLRGIALIDLGFLQDWQGGAINMIDRLTDKDDTQGNSPGWYPKIIRINITPPDSVSGWPHPFNPNNTDLYDLLRLVVNYCATKDMYCIIDWHYIDNTYSHVASTSEFWTYMAPRFANDSHVFFELFNEPINNTFGSDAANWASVKADMQTWINIVRTYAPNNIILVAGPNWSQAIGPIASNPPTGSNIAVVSHIYPGHWRNPSWYQNHITTCAAVFPIMMTEWGFSQSGSPDPEDLLNGTITGYGQPLSNFREQYKIGHTAWVASYDWGPPMFWSDWTLRIGEGEMGGFTKDLLYTYRNNDQPGGGDTTPPAAPTGLTATAGEEMVTLNWNNNGEGDLAGYNVYRSMISGGPYSKLNGSLLTSSDYIDNDVDGYVTYYYVVRAVDTSLNESGNSNQASATPTDTTPPAAPTGLTAAAGDGTVTLNWNNNGEGDLDGYNVYRSTTSGSGYVKQNGSLLTSSDYIDNSVTNGITYYYVVTAEDTSSNESIYSGEVSATPAIQTDVEIIGSWVSGDPHTHIKESGTNRALIFIAHAEHTAEASLTSVTYGGQPMTKVVERVVSSGNPVYYAYVIAYILNEQGVAAATSGTFVPTWSTSPSVVAYESVFLQNNDQSTPVGATASNSTTSSNPITTAALSTNNGDMVIDAATCGNNGSYTLNNGFTEGADQSVGTYGLTGSAGHKSATGVSETPSATHSSSINRQVIIGFVVNAQAAPVYSDCDEVLAAGHRLPADISGAGNCYVDYEDFDTFVEYWLDTSCTEPDNCHGADFVPTDGVVDLFDFSDFAMQWLVCNNPEDPECPHNW